MSTTDSTPPLPFDTTPAAASSAGGSAPRKPRLRLVSRRALKRLGILAILIAAALAYCYGAMLSMPGASHRGPLPPVTSAQATSAAQLRTDVEALASGIGRRSTFQPRKMAEAARHIIAELRQAGFSEHEETFVERGSRVPNICVEIRGRTRPSEIVVIGAHYDSYQGTPGADDNASGVAALLALARRYGVHAKNATEPGGDAPATRMTDPPAAPARTLRLVFFVNEEPPSFMTDDMGSLVYARHCLARGDTLVAMMSLETLGYYDDATGSQKYPSLLGSLFPDRGDFLAFVGNYASRSLVKQALSAFRESTPFPSEGAALPGGIPGVGWSDHWAFWQVGCPAFMVTDTAPFRNPHYHLETDTPDTLNYERLARLVEGLEYVVSDLVR